MTKSKKRVEAGKWQSQRFGSEDAKRSLILFHGYTGSPDDFADFPELLSKELDVFVYVPLLPGHGTSIRDLMSFNYDNFLTAAREAIREVSTRGYPFAIGGHSFGSFLAMQTAAETNPSGLFTTVIPHTLRFPFTPPIGNLFVRIKPLWTKHIPDYEMDARQGTFFYTEMPGKGLGLIIEGKRRNKEIVAKITCPVLTIHTQGDTFAHAESGAKSIEGINSAIQNNLIIESIGHSIFYYEENRETLMHSLSDFLNIAFSQTNGSK